MANFVLILSHLCITMRIGGGNIKHTISSFVIRYQVSLLDLFFDVICECVINQKKKSYILKSDTTGFFFLPKGQIDLLFRD